MEQGGHVGEERRFKAFVSYSHADKAAAQRLHRKLETYRLPKHLREQSKEDTEDGRIGAIFRDREDLPAAEDLTESVKQALAASEALVVLCSPDAKASPWVAREIELFRELHPGRPVLAALLRGEPEEAFPEPLSQGREPLAADLRKEGDGPRLGFLKIVAGVAGVPLDTLVNRDAQRRIRRVTAVTVAALAAMVVMALMTTFAIQQRNEAQTQREGAEGLVEYMLTDLRTELRGVGRLDVMSGVNERALVYYDSQGDLSGFPAESLERRAAILLAMGEDELNRVDADEDQAQNYFREAYRTTAETLSRRPSDADRLFAHGQSQFWMGYIEFSRGKFGEAAEWFKLYVGSAEKLRVVEKDSSRSLRELAYGQGNLCSVAIKDQSALEAPPLVYCSAALDYLRSAIGGSVSSDRDAQDLINRLNWYAEALVLSDDRTASKDQFEMAERIVDELIKRDSKNLDLKDIWLTIQIALAEAEIGSGARPSAQSRLQNAERVAASLVASDQSNKSWLGHRRKIAELIDKGE